MMTVAAQNLRPGDELRNGTTVEDVSGDSDGVWVTTTDGGEGYTNYDQQIKVAGRL